MMASREDANTIIRRLKFYTEKDPEKDAFVFISKDSDTFRFSRKQIWTLAGQCAAIFKGFGIQKGDIVCNTLQNSRARLITDLGIIMAGAATLNGQILLLDGQDIFGSMSASGCKMLISASSGSACEIFRPYITTNSMEEAVGPGQERLFPVSCKQCPDLAWLMTIETDSHEEISAFVQNLQTKEDFYAASVTPNDEAYVLTTSGSTGFSKLVPRNHWEILTIADQVAHIMEEGELIYSDRPFGWIAGIPHEIFSKGGTRYLQEKLSGQKQQDLAQFWNFLLDCGVTIGFILPHDLVLLEKEFDAGHLQKKLKVISTGGQPVGKTLHRVTGKATEQLRVMYGSTEIGLPVCGLIDSNNKDSFEDSYTGTVFEPSTEICFMDEALKKIETPRKQGKLFFRGGTVLRRYLNKEQSTTNVFTEDGWFDTGDNGYQNEKGQIFVTGRASDTIEYGTTIVYPGWLEERIQRCPGVKDVIVIGIPHPSLYEELCACVVREPDASLTEAELLVFCKSMFAPDSPEAMTPVPEKYLFVDGFPVNENGKVSRKSNGC